MMSTADDRRATLVLLLLAAAGLGVKLVVTDSGAPGSVGYRAGTSTGPVRDSVVARALQLTRPLRRGEKIDLDRATATELNRLPRIGPALAARIVTERETNGAFGSLAGLSRVRGIGPTAVATIRPHATFSGRGGKAVGLAPGGPVTLNTASPEELARLPGIGLVKAKAMSDRKRHGPFVSLDDLTRVRGIGKVTVSRLEGLVRVP